LAKQNSANIPFTIEEKFKNHEITYYGCMNSFALKILLIREKQEFQACIACIQGGLKEGILHLEKLHPNEKSIFNAYRDDRRKESYLLGRLTAKRAILELSNISSSKSIWIDKGVFQFPIVKGANLQNIQVSISHCDTIGFSIAYPEAHPMGIDVEKVHSDRSAEVLSQLTNEEKLLLKDNANISGYTAIFSIKEALSKVIRTGMMLDFKFFEIEAIKETQQILECTFTHFGQYKAFAFFKRGYVFSIVLPKRTNVQLDKLWQMIDDLRIVGKS
jgi:4'-phosphopantetheinyl transferase